MKTCRTAAGSMSSARRGKLPGRGVGHILQQPTPHASRLARPESQHWSAGLGLRCCLQLTTRTHHPRTHLLDHLLPILSEGDVRDAGLGVISNTTQRSDACRGRSEIAAKSTASTHVSSVKGPFGLACAIVSYHHGQGEHVSERWREMKPTGKPRRTVANEVDPRHACFGSHDGVL
jgi:hypothetical protein